MRSITPSKYRLNVNEFSQGWANFVHNRRKQRQMTRRKLSELVGIDPSLMTLIENNGHIPARDTVHRIAAEFGEVEGGMLAAGMLPNLAQAHAEKLSLKRRRWANLQDKLPEDAINALELLTKVSHSRQVQGLQILDAYVTGTMKTQPGRKRVANG